MLSRHKAKYWLAQASLFISCSAAASCFASSHSLNLVDTPLSSNTGQQHVSHEQSAAMSAMQLNLAFIHQLNGQSTSFAQQGRCSNLSIRNNLLLVPGQLLSAMSNLPNYRPTTADNLGTHKLLRLPNHLALTNQATQERLELVSENGLRFIYQWHKPTQQYFSAVLTFDGFPLLLGSDFSQIYATYQEQDPQKRAQIARSFKKMKYKQTQTPNCSTQFSAMSLDIISGYLP